MGEQGTCGTGGRRRHSKKRTQRPRRRRMRGGTTLASLNSVETTSNGLKVPGWQPSNMSGSSFTTPQMGEGAPSTMAGYSGGRRTRRKHRRGRRSRYRMRGGTGGMSVGYGFTDSNPIGGVAVGARVWSPVSASGHGTDAAGYNRGF